jgi:hypothetical protein
MPSCANRRHNREASGLARHRETEMGGTFSAKLGFRGKIKVCHAKFAAHDLRHTGRRREAVESRPLSTDPDHHGIPPFDPTI